MTEEAHEYRIYLDDRAQLYAVVDEDDWHHFSQWLWLPKVSRGGRKIYARRAVGVWDYENNCRSHVFSMYLHIEIMKRIEPPPTIFHTIADHLNGDSLNCRRRNLRWATPKMNRRNIHGVAMTQLDMLQSSSHITSAADASQKPATA